LRKAHEGIVFLDEIGELGCDEQAMLLKAIEEKRFFPMGADRETHSDFQLIAGTNRDLRDDVRSGRFRDDLLARINLWTFKLPALRERLEDIEPNIDYELERHAEIASANVRFNAEAREAYVRFATSPAAEWTGNFRELSASVSRMATLADGGRITEALVRDELDRLRGAWSPARENGLEGVLSAARLEGLDLFDRLQLQSVVEVCRHSGSLAEAGRKLFAVTREKRTVVNDSDRLRKYLARFGLDWSALRADAD
jgi:transcriptional regulatory protein RtcR